MADKKKQGRELTTEEREELRDGQVLYEMTQTAGWQVIKKWLEDRAFHSWMDPRAADSKEEWVWREMNLFHSSDVARELLAEIQKAVDQAEYLEKVKQGEVDERSMKI